MGKKKEKIGLRLFKFTKIAAKKFEECKLDPKIDAFFSAFYAINLKSFK
jgi:hypothetical protein